jgi:hypothetical protein
MTTPTSNAVPSNDVNDLLFNAEKLDEAISGTADFYVDRLGAQHLTMVGAMKKLGYQVPVAFASGLSITAASQTVIYSGLTYHANPASVPFTTTSTFSSAQWLLVSNATLQDLASTASGKGASLLGVQDAAGKYSSTTVEGALAEVATTAEITAAAIRSGVATGTADALIAAFSNPITTLTHGQTILVRATYANATTTPTLQVNALPARTIVKGNNLPLAAGDIAGAGHWIELQVDNTLSTYVLQNPATGVVSPVTVASDPSYADSSAKSASTGWVRAAFSVIAAAAGFVCSLTVNGYVKFPSWLGSWIFQWGTASTSTGGGINVTWPIAYPTGPLCAVSAGINSVAGNAISNVGSLYPTYGVFYGTNGSSGAVSTAGSIGFYWFSVGK